MNQELLKTRPERRSPEIIAAVAAKLAPKVFEWTQDNGWSLEEITRDLKKALRFESDGYAIAKRMDDYAPDAELVEILDCAGYMLSSEYELACRAWVAENAITGPEVGAAVVYRHPRNGEVAGTVTKNWPDGRSTVCVPSLGHVTEGCGCHGFIAEWEELRQAAEVSGGKEGQ